MDDMCGMMLIDMHGVRYANNLLKNPATKRLSGKTTHTHIFTTNFRLFVLLHLIFSLPLFFSIISFIPVFNILNYAKKIYTLEKLLTCGVIRSYNFVLSNA